MFTEEELSELLRQQRELCLNAYMNVEIVYNNKQRQINEDSAAILNAPSPDLSSLPLIGGEQQLPRFMTEFNHVGVIQTAADYADKHYPNYGKDWYVSYNSYLSGLKDMHALSLQPPKVEITEEQLINEFLAWTFKKGYEVVKFENSSITDFHYPSHKKISEEFLAALSLQKQQ
jgi:hypothetical protein